MVCLFTPLHWLGVVLVAMAVFLGGCVVGQWVGRGNGD